MEPGSGPGLTYRVQTDEKEGKDLVKRLFVALVSAAVIAGMVGVLPTGAVASQKSTSSYSQRHDQTLKGHQRHGKFLGTVNLARAARAHKRVPDTGKVAKGWLRYLRVTHHSAIGRAPRNPLGLKIPSPKAFNLKNNPGASTSFRGQRRRWCWLTTRRMRTKWPRTCWRRRSTTRSHRRCC